MTTEHITLPTTVHNTLKSFDSNKTHSNEELDEITSDLTKKLQDEIQSKNSTSINSFVLREAVLSSLYNKINDKIVYWESKTKLKVRKCYVDLGKHFGNHRFKHPIPDEGKNMHYKDKNKRLVHWYFRLRKLLFSDDDGAHAPSSLSDLQKRKARNIFYLYDQIGEEKIKKLKTKFAITLFALSKEDAKHVAEEVKKRDKYYDHHVVEISKANGNLDGNAEQEKDFIHDKKREHNYVHADEIFELEKED